MAARFGATLAVCRGAAGAFQASWCVFGLTSSYDNSTANVYWTRDLMQQLGFEYMVFISFG